jgi:hypothetical protein
VGGAVVWPAGAAAEHAGQGLFPDAGGELAQALPLAGDPGAAAEGLVDGVGGGADGGLDALPGVLVQLGEVAALRLEDLGELADVEIGPAMPRRAVQRRQAGRSIWPNLPGSRR